MKHIQFFFLFVFFYIHVFSQDITLTPVDTIQSNILGHEFEFKMNVKNISQSNQSIFLKRSVNDLPMGWQSSLCFESCFAQFIDSVATTPDFNSTPLLPDETRQVAVHIFSAENTGTANVQIQCGTLRQPDTRITINFKASALTTSVGDNRESTSFRLEQNYPNPFNPSTTINFNLPLSDHVQLTIFDAMGNQIAKVIDAQIESGYHSFKIDFTKAAVSSGVYFYQLITEKSIVTKKMIFSK